MQTKPDFYPVWRWGSYSSADQEDEFILDDFGNLIPMDAVLLLQNMHSVPVTQSIY